MLKNMTSMLCVSLKPSALLSSDVQSMLYDSYDFIYNYDTPSAIETLNIILNIMRNTYSTLIPHYISLQVEANILQALVELGMSRYNRAHDLVSDAYYILHNV